MDGICKVREIENREGLHLTGFRFVVVVLIHMKLK